jgi:thioredoxin 1
MGEEEERRATGKRNRETNFPVGTIMRPSGRIQPSPEGRGGRERMAEIVEATDQNFESEVLKADRPVLVDFWADWCVPCHMVSPIVEEIGQDRSDTLKVAKLNVDDNPEMSRRYGVMSIPTLILFSAGEEKARVIGAKPKDAILREIEPHVAA